MAFYDKSARMVYAVGLSLIIHAVLIGLLVGARTFSDDSPREEPTGTTETLSKDTDSQESAKPMTDAPSEEPARADPIFPERTDRPPPAPVAKPQPKKEKRVESAKTETKEKDEPSSSRSNATEIHVVRKGESLTSIARAHGCTLTEIKQLNKTTLKKNNSLFVGQKLKVPKK